MATIPPERVDRRTIREIFNDCQELQRLVSEKVNIATMKRSHLTNPEEKRLPWCTHSESLRFHNDSGTHSVLIHQYQLPDGTIGASGLPDPKQIKINEKVYFCN